MSYYSLGNVVYADNKEVVCVVTPVFLIKSMANMFAERIATHLNSFEADSSDVLRGSLD